MMRSLYASMFAILCVASPAASQPVNDATARQAADDLARKFETAYNAGKPSGIADLFAKGGVYLTPGGTNLKDRQDIEQAVAARIKAGWTRESITPVEVHASGDNVWLYGTYRIEGTGANQGKAIDGYFTQVLTKEGSDWKLLLVIANLKTPQDVTGMSAATPGK
jgi:uncharacterized protein (TIGR02246 family)